MGTILIQTITWYMQAYTKGHQNGNINIRCQSSFWFLFCFVLERQVLSVNLESTGKRDPRMLLSGHTPVLKFQA